MAAAVQRLPLAINAAHKSGQITTRWRWLIIIDKCDLVRKQYIGHGAQ